MEHLSLYGALKGIPLDHLEEEVQKVLAMMDMDPADANKVFPSPCRELLTDLFPHRLVLFGIFSAAYFVFLASLPPLLLSLSWLHS